MTHPSVAPLVRELGTLAGLPVRVVVLGGTWCPWLPRPLMDVGGSSVWLQLGAAPWTRGAERITRRILPDPDGSPWSAADLPALLVEMEVPELEDADWPTPHDQGCERPDHWSACLPAARRRAAERYAQLALDSLPRTR